MGRECRRIQAGSTGRCARLALASALLAWAAAGSAGAQTTRIAIVGDAPRNGIFDPSVEYAPGASEGWLAYSAVYGDTSPWGPHVETRLAKTHDGGATWTFSAVVNPSVFTDLDLGGGQTLPGVWNYEVSSLAYDGADTGAEWKLFAHKIFRQIEDDFTTEQNLPAYSWIVLRTAPDPTGPWSPEVALLSSGPLPPAPYDSVSVAVNDLDPSLASLLVYSEPGAFVRDGVLYLSLTGLLASGSDRILLLASDDHGATWRFVATLLDNSDAAALGYLGFDGSAIVSQGGRFFLLTTPESPGLLHDGTLAFEFADLAAGTLVRSGGVPVVHLWVPPQPGLPAERRGGQADYHEGNVAAGILQHGIHVEDMPEMFQIHATDVHPLGQTAAVPLLGWPAQLALVVAIGWAGRARLARRRA